MGGFGGLILNICPLPPLRLYSVGVWLLGLAALGGGEVASASPEFIPVVRCSVTGLHAEEAWCVLLAPRTRFSFMLNLPRAASPGLEAAVALLASPTGGAALPQPPRALQLSKYLVRGHGRSFLELPLSRDCFRTILGQGGS